MSHASPTAPRGGFPIARRLLRIALLGYLGACLLMLLLENSLIYFPLKYPEGNWALPPGLEIEDAWFTAADGVRLHGWYLRGENPRAAILFAHGNAGNITHRTQLLLELRQHARASILIFDYRGYGRSEGSPGESGVLADARAARAWLAQREGIAERDVVLLGESLGGAVMVDLAAKDGARGLILEGSFTSLPDIAAKHFPWLPVRLLMRNRLDSLSKIGDYRGPLLQAHGDCDRIVPYENAQRLFAAANEPKQFVTMTGCDHNDAWAESFYMALDRFLDGLPEIANKH